MRHMRARFHLWHTHHLAWCRGKRTVVRARPSGGAVSCFSVADEFLMFVQMQIIALGCVRSERLGGWTTVPFLEFDADSYTLLSNLVSVNSAKTYYNLSGTASTILGENYLEFVWDYFRSAVGVGVRKSYDHAPEGTRTEVLAAFLKTWSQTVGHCCSQPATSATS